MTYWISLRLPNTSRPLTWHLGTGRSGCTMAQLRRPPSLLLRDFSNSVSCCLGCVFQRLMERGLAGLNPEDGPAFVAVYIDDVIVFSRTLEDHLQRLRQVIQRISDAGLKLKPTKCRFIREEVEYLGHLITPHGLKTNPRLTAAVANFLLLLQVRPWLLTDSQPPTVIDSQECPV